MPARYTKRMMLAVAIGAVAASPVHSGAPTAVIGPDLQAVLATAAPNARIPIIITLADQVDAEAVSGKDKTDQRLELIEALKDKADATQDALAAFLVAQGASDQRQLWIINSLAAKVPAAALNGLQHFPGVARITLDKTVRDPNAPPSEPVPAPAADSTSTPTGEPGWNLTAVQAPQLWTLGYTGQGTVVGIVDSGVDADHPDLAPRQRSGGTSWFDPHGEHATPYDYSGHGTAVAGIALGGDAGGTTIGMAPGATWIAAKVFDDAGLTTYSAIHASLQWMLDPDGSTLTDDAPDVVNGSWGFRDQVGQCITEFEQDIAVLRAADIAMVFSAGNTGPEAGTSESPGNNAGALAVGAVDAANAVASFSARGPSACDGTLYPELVAPGVNVYSADRSFGGFALYQAASGTSFAAPHLSGAMALLRSAAPAASMAQIEDALIGTAVDLGAAGADDAYGFGLIAALDAHYALGQGAQAPTAGDDAYELDQDSLLSVPAPGVLANDADPQGDPLEAQLLGATANGAVALAPDGGFTYRPAAGFAGDDAFSYKASDGVYAGNVATVHLRVHPIAAGPVDTDADGFSTDVDCDDGDANIHPGAAEIKHDGIDQDCNGFDLTIDIVSAVYGAKGETLDVAARSALGASANLEVVGYGAMKWDRKQEIWTLSTRRIGSKTGSVTVRGAEGEWTGSVQ